MVIFVVTVFEVILGLVVKLVNFLMEDELRDWLYNLLGFNHPPADWIQFLIVGGLYLVGLIVLFLLFKIEFFIGRKDEDHLLYPVYKRGYKVLGNYKEYWPPFYLVPLSVIHGILVLFPDLKFPDGAYWWSVTILLLGLWAIYADPGFKKKIEEESETVEEEEQPFTQGPASPENLFYEDIVEEEWFHNQVVFRTPWPGKLDASSPAEYQNAENRFLATEEIPASDSFNRAIAEDPVLTGLAQTLLFGADPASSHSFFSHQQKVFEIFSRRVDENGDPIHLLLTTPIGSGRTTVEIMAAIRRVLEYHENVLFIFKEPAEGRVLAQKVLNGLRDSGWDWSLSMVEYWSDEDFARSSIYGHELEDLKNPDILITDIDTVHQRLLPGHEEWYRYLSGVGLVMVEGLEKYGGIQGANAVQVFIRLKRILRYYEANPQIIGTSTYFRNLENFFERLFSISAKKFDTDQIITQDGRARKAKEILVWNTAVAHHKGLLSGRRPALKQDALDQNIRQLLLQALRAGRKPVLLSKTFKICGSDVSQINEDVHGLMVEQGVSGNGFTVGDNIEMILSENGAPKMSSPLDVDTAIVAGVPGSWYQVMHELEHLGGRRESVSSVVLMLPYTPLYQYLSRNFTKFVRKDGSKLQPPQLPDSNPFIREAHLKAALAELPATEEEVLDWFGLNGLNAARRLLKDGELLIEERFELLSDDEGMMVEKLVNPDKEEIERTSIQYVGANVWRLLIDGFVDEHHRYISEDQIGWKIYPRAVITLNQQRFMIQDLDFEDKFVLALRADMDEPTSTERVIKLEPGKIVFEEKESGTTVLASHQYFEGAQNILIADPQWIRVQESITGYCSFKSFSYFNTGGALVYDPPMQRPEFRTRGFVLGFPGAEEVVLHTLSHLIRSVIPLFLDVDSLDFEILALEKCEVVKDNPAILIYDPIRGGTGFADWFNSVEKIRKVLEACLDLLLDCPCKDGCRGCVSIHHCNQFDLSKTMCDHYDKEKTITYLGKIFLSDFQEIIDWRTEPIKSHAALDKIRDKIVDYVFPHKLGLQIEDNDKARLSWNYEFPEGIGGLYVGAENMVYLRPAPEERSIVVIAHEYAHNWQFRGTEKMHPDLMDPRKIPFNGKLFVEGFAQWVEYKVADFYGLHWFKDEIKFHNYNEYLEGFRILYWIEYEYRGGEGGLGANKVIEFITTGRLMVEDEEIDLETMIMQSGVEASLRDAIARYKEKPPTEDLIEETEEGETGENVEPDQPAGPSEEPSDEDSGQPEEPSTPVESENSDQAGVSGIVEEKPDEDQESPPDQSSPE